MKKYILSIAFIFLGVFLFGQNTLTIEGQVLNTEGSPAVDVSLILFFPDLEELFLESSGVDGSYLFELEGLEYENTCFELILYDCNGLPIIISDCSKENSNTFIYNFDYCVEGSDFCNTSILPLPMENGDIELSLILIGQGPYNYMWSNGESSNSITVPNSGAEYCVTVTASDGCESTACIDLSPPDPCFVFITPTYFETSVLLTADAQGQDDNISYEWSTGELSESIEVTTNDTYCVTITDGLGCSTYDCITIQSINEVDCFTFIYQIINIDDSIVYLGADSFGEEPFNYLWSTGDTTELIEVENSGEYCVTVTDATGCVNEDCTYFTAWDECDVYIACDPLENLVNLVAIPFGIGFDHNYEWSTGETDQSIIVSESGEYCVTVTDELGCVAEQCITLDLEAIFECFTPIMIEKSNGAASLSIDLDGEDYTIEWSTGDYSNSINVYESGQYCVNVFNFTTGCSFSTCIDVVIDDLLPCEAHIVSLPTGLGSVILNIANSFGLFVDLIEEYDIEVLWNTGETSPNLEVFESGVYCANIVIGDCVLEICENVDLENEHEIHFLVGYYDYNLQKELDGLLEVYEVTEEGNLNFVKEVAPIPNNNLTGIFEVSEIPSGKYVLYVKPSDAEGYVPSYSLSTSNWEKADIIKIEENYPAIPFVPIHAIAQTKLAGPGKINGEVILGFLANQNSTETSLGPLVNANILLLHNGVHVDQDYTSEDGSFFFGNLPYGTYIVALEIPGEERQEIEVVITEENSTVFIDFNTLSSTTEAEPFTSVTLSPNPTAGALNVSLGLKLKAGAKIQILNNVGQTVYEASTSEEADNINLQLEHLSPGLYNFIIENKDHRRVSRFIKI